MSLPILRGPTPQVGAIQPRPPLPVPGAPVDELGDVLRLLHNAGLIVAPHVAEHLCAALAGDAESIVQMAGVLTVNNADAYMAACLAGLGMIQAPLLGGAAHLKCGDLIEVLPRYRAAPLPLTLLYADRRIPPRVRVFMEWLESVVRPCLAAA